MSDENSTKAAINASAKRRKEKELQFITYEMEEQMDKKLAKVKKKLKIPENTNQTISEIVENDNIRLHNLDGTVGTMIKNEALKLYPRFYDLSTNEQTIVSLGLNSIIDVSFDYPDAQTTLFDQRQWKDLKKMFPPSKYNTNQYEYIKSIVNPVINSYKHNKPSKVNWAACHQHLKILEQKYDVDENEEHNDISFCLQFLRIILNILKHQQHLFSEEVDNSEWDYIVKLWGPVAERLFFNTGLRLKWGDTTLTMNDVSDAELKVDLRVINDNLVQRYNKELEVSLAEVAKEDPGTSKYQSDRCKLHVESKIVLDNYLGEGCDVDSVDSIQFCGMEFIIMNLALEAHGLYIGKEAYHGSITNSLSGLAVYVDMAIQLLCFRDKSVELKNLYDFRRSLKSAIKKSVKSTEYNQHHSPLKKKWTRGNWIASRKKNSMLPPLPVNLTNS